MMLMKLQRIVNFIYRLFVRIAHVAYHVTCDEVPHIHDEED